MKKHFALLLTFFLTITIYGQKISYSDLNVSSVNLKKSLRNSDNYFSNEPHELPYFQGKTDSKYIKFYKSTGTVVTIDFKSQTEYLSLINEIQQRANFRFKFCTDYEENIVYNYITSSGNKIRFNFNEIRISIEYSSSTNKFLDSNSEFTTAFVCVSKDAYAYHTNLRCEGLGNCDAKIAKTNFKEAKKYKYRFCEICTSDNKSKKLLTETLLETTSESDTNNNEYSNRDYEYDYELDESYENDNYEEDTSIVVKKAEQMFANYLPKILKSKGEGAFIDIQSTHTGDFTNDGLSDVIIWFNYSLGGMSIDGYECALYENIGNDVKVVAGFQPNYIFTVSEITNGIIYIEKSEYAENDARCCPSIFTTIKLIYKGNKVLTLE
jgi:hypothetical protein